MAEGVNVRITGKLRRFIEEQASPPVSERSTNGPVAFQFSFEARNR